MAVLMRCGLGLFVSEIHPAVTIHDNPAQLPQQTGDDGYSRQAGNPAPESPSGKGQNITSNDGEPNPALQGQHGPN